MSLVNAAEREQLQAVIEKSFVLDPGWNAALHIIDAQVKSSIAAAFERERFLDHTLQLLAFCGFDQAQAVLPRRGNR